MFDRFIRLAKARKALREQCFEDALLLASDPLIRTDRRAEQIKATAASRLVERARQRLDDGDLGAARTELQRVRAVVDSPEVARLGQAIEAAASGDAQALELARRNLSEARRLLERGETAMARAVLAACSSGPLSREQQQIEKQLAERARQAVAMCEQARQSLADGAVAAAIEKVDRAEAMDRDAPEIGVARHVLVPAAGAHFASLVQERLRAQDLMAALDCYHAAATPLTAVHETEPMLVAQQAIETELLARFSVTKSVADASALAEMCRSTHFEGSGPLSGLLEALHLVHVRSAGAESAAVSASLETAAKAAGAGSLAAAAASLADVVATQDECLLEARRRLDSGLLDEARDLLIKFLTEAPLCEAARQELQLVDQGLEELERRLAEVRSAARAGRLREACAAAVALVGSARVATEAQQIVAEARARMALVERGLDEVRVALHGRVAASQDGVRHCLLRLEELGKVQVDHEQLPKVIAAVQAELEALAAFDRIGSAIDQHAVDEALAAITSLLPVRERLLTQDRLDARWCGLADRLGLMAERVLAAGRLGMVGRCAEVLVSLSVVRSEFAARGARLRDAIESRQKAAADLVAQALASLQVRDLAEAERLAEQADRQWSESAEVRALVQQLAQLRRQSEALDRVDVLTKERDYLGAQQKLAEMPPTQQLLRTRIYDMKQNLARAQGLEGAFLLRVDEGGEHLVVRGETLSIGNVRQTRADLPVLANVAGRHASIRRSMSFHGGMQDSIVAEEGEVRVGGEAVAKRALEPGDRVQLGPAFAFVYQRPCSRSLSAGLLLQGGFQIAGTDRVLLMKDRGRDGRLVLGAAKDVHVRVAKAVGEVEVFATNTGQMRVFCEAGGTLDGVPFRGEHPLAAGQIVAAAGMSFTMLPWR